MPEIIEQVHPHLNGLSFAFVRRSSGFSMGMGVAERRLPAMPARQLFTSRLSGRPNVRVNRFLLTGTLDYGFRLNQPILVKVANHSDGTNVVTDDFSSTYGTGDTTTAAIQDYKLSLAESFEILLEDKESLGSALQRELTRLMAYVSQVDDAS